MKYKLVVTGALALTIVGLDSSSSEAATSRIQSKGETAQVSLFESTAITCDDGSTSFLDTSLFIQGAESGVRSSFGNSNTETILLFYSDFNGCTGEFNSAVVFEDAADFDQTRVNSASIAGDFELINFDGTPIGTLSVDLDLTGVGDITRSNSHSITQSGNFVFNSRFAGTFREATIAGTVSLDGDPISTAGGFAQLSDTRSGDITVSHP
jgi:hypothetical protein